MIHLQTVPPPMRFNFPIAPTPYPWKAVRHYIDPRRDGSHPYLTLNGADGYEIAAFNGKPTMPNEEQRRAEVDIALCAAAPEMYDLICRFCLDCEMSGKREKCDCGKCKIRKLIEKIRIEIPRDLAMCRIMQNIAASAFETMKMIEEKEK